MSLHGPSRRFAAVQQLGRFRGKGDIGPRSQSRIYASAKARSPGVPLSNARIALGCGRYRLGATVRSERRDPDAELLRFGDQEWLAQVALDDRHAITEPT
jgi:hypothetical protein